jgi:hypothetical protein
MENKNLKDIEGYEGQYSVSELGEVWSHKTNKYLSLADDTYGYLTVNLSGDKEQHTVKVHRIVANAFLPNPDNRPQIDHIDRNRANNNVTNLKWVTISENASNKAPRKVKLVELKNIEVKKSSFKVVIRRKGKCHYKTFKTLDEAKAYRDEYIKTTSLPESPASL